MEQRLNPTYISNGPFERAAAVAIAATGLGTGVLLAAWGISLFWRYTAPEIAVRVANPEVRIIQDRPITVSQDSPFVLAPPDPLKIEQGKITVKAELPPNVPQIDKTGSDAHTAAGEIIKRAVTVFSQVQHGAGAVVTGWDYKNGGGGTPFRQFCYFTSSNLDRSSRRVDIAIDGVRRPQIGVDLVPDLEAALSKCQWWQS